MQWINDLNINVERLCPLGLFDPDEFIALKPREIFERKALEFISDFSVEVLKNPEARKYPEIIALGFWMRRANISKIKASFESVYGNRVFVGRGFAFHIAPSNVDTLFIYPLFLSLLAGNTNIVRVSSKLNRQLALVLSLLVKVLGLHPEIAKRILVVSYGHDDKVTELFSGVCNLRMIWGGDESVLKIRSIPIPPHASELSFPGKFSVAVLNACAWNLISRSEQKNIAKNFTNDSFVFNQQGCASPKLVYWCGTNGDVAKAKASFWPMIEQCVADMPFTVDAADAMNRLVSVCYVAIGAKSQVEKIDSKAHSFIRINVNSLSDVNREANSGNGMFFEYTGISLDDLLIWFRDNDQTISSFGVTSDNWRESLSKTVPKGICRIVPMGKALEFSSIWDGYDLIRDMCREITIEL